MKHTGIESNWDTIKGKLKQRYGQLTDDDLTFTSGKVDELYGRLREKLNLSQDDLDAVLDDLKSDVGNRVEQAKAKASDLADEVREKVGHVVEDAKAKGAAAVDEMKTQAGAAYGQARQRARSMREDGEQYVRQNPRESLIAAVCAGFVAGLLIRR